MGWANKINDLFLIFLMSLRIGKGKIFFLISVRYYLEGAEDNLIRSVH